MKIDHRRPARGAAFVHLGDASLDQRPRRDPVEAGRQPDIDVDGAGVRDDRVAFTTADRRDGQPGR
jgi:hypothetical protein